MGAPKPIEYPDGRRICVYSYKASAGVPRVTSSFPIEPWISNDGNHVLLDQVHLSTWERCGKNCGSHKVSIYAHDTDHQITGRWLPIARKRGRRSSMILLSTAAVALLVFHQPISQGIKYLARCQPQNSKVIFPRTRSPDKIALSKIAGNEQVVSYLLKNWPGDYLLATDGNEREQLLSTGAQAYSAYLNWVGFDHNMNDDDISTLQNIFRATPTRRAEVEQVWRLQLQQADEEHHLQPNTVLLRETQKRIRRECVAKAINNIPLEEGPMLEMRNMLIKLLEDHDDKHSYASAALIEMITAGIVLRSREQESHDAKIASRLSLGLGLTGAVAGFFPAASPAVGLFVVLARILVNNVADRHIKIHEAIEDLALQWANASMLGSNDPQYAISIQVAINHMGSL